MGRFLCGIQADVNARILMWEAFFVVSWLQALSSINVPATVYTLVGREFVLMDWFIRSLHGHLEQTSGEAVEVNPFRFEEEGCAGAIFACQSVSLFSTSSLVVLENCTAMLASGKAKHDTSEMESYLANPIPNRTLVITVVGDKMDERKKLTKLAKSQVVVDCSTPKEHEALDIVQRLATERDILMAPDGLKELWRRSQSISHCVAELDKLWTYTDARPITANDVAQLVALPLEDNVFAWIDGVVKGDLERSFHALKDVEMSGSDPFALLSLIARQLRLMWYARVFGGKGYSHQQIAGKTGAHPYAVRVAGDQARSISPHVIERLTTIVADAEYEIKSGRRDIRQALEWVILSCASTSN
jgi:DNA polymerase III subunit delta